MATHNKVKTITLPPDLIRAVEILLAQRKCSTKRGAKNFSAAVAEGLRKYLRANELTKETTEYP